MRKLIYLLILLIIQFTQGCTMRSGALQPHTQFVYPNSNVRILGPVSEEISKTTFLGINGFFSYKDILNTYQKALSQQNGADVLVNFKEDTTYTNYILFVKSTYKVSGDAASMQVGKQVLK